MESQFDSTLETDINQVLRSIRPRADHFQIPGSKTSFPGEYDFKLCVRDGESRGICHYHEVGKSKRIFVAMKKPWILKVMFRLPLTPKDMYIRLIPLFISSKRSTDSVQRCANHTDQEALQQGMSQSFITVNLPGVTYQHGASHLLTRQLNTLIPVNKSRLIEEASFPRIENNNDSELPDSQASLELPFVTEDISCQVHCYSSCFGFAEKGRVEIVIRLEDLTNPNEPRILGMDRIEVRCSATPSRDFKLYLERERILAKSSSRKRPSVSCSEYYATGDGDVASSSRSHKPYTHRRLALTSIDLTPNAPTSDLQLANYFRFHRNILMATREFGDSAACSPARFNAIEKEMLLLEERLIERCVYSLHTDKNWSTPWFLAEKKYVFNYAHK